MSNGSDSKIADVATSSESYKEAKRAVRPEKSFGEYMFDAGVYGGLGYLANAAISLAIIRYATHLKNTPLSQLNKHTHAGFEAMTKMVTENPESIKYWSNKLNEVFMLGSGGWALMVPMKWAEDAKPELVQEIDRMFGTGPKTEQDKLVQYAQLNDSPRQSYGSLFSGRLVAYVITVATALPFITKLTPVNKKMNEFLMKKFGNRLGPLAAPVEVANGVEVPSFINAVSMETVLAGTAAGLHFGVSKLIANGLHNIRQDNELKQQDNRKVLENMQVGRPTPQVTEAEPTQERLMEAAALSR